MESCLGIPGMLRRSLLGEICSAGSLKLFHTLDKLFGAGVFLSFREFHLFHLFFEKAGNGPECLFARTPLPSLGLRGWKRRHPVTLSIRPLRHASLLHLPTPGLCLTLFTSSDARKLRRAHAIKCSLASAHVPCFHPTAPAILLTYVYAGGVCAEFFGGARQRQS
jgi:hypothetical protein